MNSIDIVSKPYRKEHEQNVARVLEGLVVVRSLATTQPEYKHLSFIQFSDMDGNWKTSHSVGNTEALQALKDKINHLIFNIGDPSSAGTMLRSVATGRLKVWRLFTVAWGHTKKAGWHRIKSRERRKCFGDTNRDDIVGHFRLGSTAYTLSPKELDAIRTFISLEN